MGVLTMWIRTSVLLLLVGLAAFGQDKKPAKTERVIEAAVIVHPKNSVTKLSLGELRGYLKLERQFWPNKSRCEVYLPTKKTAGYKILLDVVYRMSHRKLQKYWVRKLFAGEIPGKPSYVPSAAAAGKRVLKTVGAISVVDVGAVPKGVRVLLIDGKKPGEKGYPLVRRIKAP